MKVGLPSDEPRWRCTVCSLLNVMANEACKRCQEPHSEEDRQANRVKMGRPSKGPSKNAIVSGSSVRRLNNPRTTNPKPRIPAATGPKKTGLTKAPIRRPAQKKKKSVGSRKVLPACGKKMTAKQLGYKSKTQGKSTMKTFVKSKLHHDTAAYRGKFEHNDKNAGSSMASISDLKSKNGWQTSLSNRPNKLRDKQKAEEAKKAAGNAGRPKKTNKGPVNHAKGAGGFNDVRKKGSFNTSTRKKGGSKSLGANIRTNRKQQKKSATSHADRPVTPPPNRGAGQRGPTLIDRLQKMCTSDAMGSLAHRDARVAQRYVNLEGDKRSKMLL